MRDIIWTIIGIWLLYKIVGVFQSMSRKTQPSKTEGEKPPRNHKEKRNALNEEGEYVDYEEIN